MIKHNLRNIISNKSWYVLYEVNYQVNFYGCGYYGNDCHTVYKEFGYRFYNCGCGFYNYGDRHYLDGYGVSYYFPSYGYCLSNGEDLCYEGEAGLELYD